MQKSLFLIADRTIFSRPPTCFGDSGFQKYHHQGVLVIAVPHNARIFVAVAPVDFRNGINGLGRFCREKMRQDPMNRAVFVFRNRRKNAMKILFYDGEGFWLLLRRLSRGKITWWPSSRGPISTLKSKELQTLILNGNPEGAEFTDDWKKILI